MAKSLISINVVPGGRYFNTLGVSVSCMAVLEGPAAKLFLASTKASLSAKCSAMLSWVQVSNTCAAMAALLLLAPRPFCFCECRISSGGSKNPSAKALQNFKYGLCVSWRILCKAVWQQGSESKTQNLRQPEPCLCQRRMQSYCILALSRVLHWASPWLSSFNLAFSRMSWSMTVRQSIEQHWPTDGNSTASAASPSEPEGKLIWPSDIASASPKCWRISDSLTSGSSTDAMLASYSYSYEETTFLTIHYPFWFVKFFVSLWKASFMRFSFHEPRFYGYRFLMGFLSKLLVGTFWKTCIWL